MNAELEKAKKYAIRLVSLRPRTSKEVSEKLEKRFFSKEIIDQTIKLLESYGMLDDALFARSWIESRLNSKPKGKKLLAQELKKKGIAPELIEQAMSRFSLSQDDEFAMARSLAEKRANALKSIPREKARQRLYGFLLRRGYSMDCALKITKDLFKDED